MLHGRIAETTPLRQDGVSLWRGAQRGSGVTAGAKAVYAALSASPLDEDGAVLSWAGAQLSATGARIEDAAAIICTFLGVDPTAEEDFNAWYDTEHLPRLCAVPGVLGAQRYRSPSHTPRYLALYLLAHTGAAESQDWRDASATPWTARMRPFTRGYLSFTLTPMKV
jgi:hypothetical protein